MALYMQSEKTVRVRWLTTIMTIALALWHMTPAAAESPLRVQLLWYHQSQFAGFYVADALGYFEREGISVELIPGGHGIDPMQTLVNESAEVAVGWMSDAMLARLAGAEIVNFAQILHRPGTMLVCRRHAGIASVNDLAGRRIGVWHLGDQHSVSWWLKANGMSPGRVEFVEQVPDAGDFLDESLDCITAMSYNEYQTILQAGIRHSELFIVRFSEINHGFLEDGLYALDAQLDDPGHRQRLAAMLRGLEDGWRYAYEHPEEALAIAMRYATDRDRDHMRRMLEAMFSLRDHEQPFGLLNLSDFERSLSIIGAGIGQTEAVEAIGQRSWTHRVWREAELAEAPGMLSHATRHYYQTVTSTTVFFTLLMIGTAFFAYAGFMRAQQRNYDLWGAFVLALLPAVGGGTIRDLLIGGDRHPPFIIQEPAYLYTVLGVMVAGTLLSRVQWAETAQSGHFARLRLLFDTLGLATFAIIGAQIALMANLPWYWVPISAALTCSGGGMLLDVVTGREPVTFQGEAYEEIASAGSLVLLGCLLVADHFEWHSPWPVATAIALAWSFVFVTRLAVVHYGWKSWRLQFRSRAESA